MKLCKWHSYQARQESESQNNPHMILLQEEDNMKIGKPNFKVSAQPHIM